MVRSWFLIPPPVIRDAIGQESGVDTSFELWLDATAKGTLVTKIPLRDPP